MENCNEQHKKHLKSASESLSMLFAQGRKSRGLVCELANAAVVLHAWVIVQAVLLHFDLSHPHHSLGGLDHLLEQVDLLLQLLAFQADGLVGLCLALLTERRSLEFVHFSLRS